MDGVGVGCGRGGFGLKEGEVSLGFTTLILVRVAS